MKTIKVVSYQRVSTQKQETDRQQKEVIDFCNYKNFNHVREFVEKESGLKDERTELTNLLNFIKDKSNDIEFVIVSEISRLGRTKETLNTIDIFHSHKIGLIAIKENLFSLEPDKTVSANTQMMLSIISAFNTAEVETTKYRMQSGRVKKTSLGYFMGNPKFPYGYMIEEKKLVINPDEAKIINEIVEMYLGGKGGFAG